MIQVQEKINEAFLMHQAGRIQDAIVIYEKILPVQPANGHLLFLFGTACYQMGRLPEAAGVLERSIRLDCNNPFAYSSLGNALKDLKRLKEALVCFNLALIINPSFTEAHSNRGMVLQDMSCVVEALISFDRALTIDPNYADIYCNRGNALRELGRLEEALGSYDSALALNPTLPPAFWNKSTVLILLGDFEMGWRLYEWRWKDYQRAYFRNYPKPLLPDTQVQNNARVFIYPEQGLGDTIQFCRYVKFMADRGCHVTFEVQAALRTLISSMDSRITLISSGEPIPAFDFQSPLLSLPWVFKTDLETVPAEGSYLSIPEEKRSEWVGRLGPKTKPRIGLVWSGSRIHKNDHNRSARLEAFLTLLRDDLEWYSLQKEYREPDLTVLDQHPQINQQQEFLKDFTDTGALVEQMDLVISVDTSVAHLAGALGRTVWILLPFIPDYRWLLGRNDTPWYPSATLYRQSENRSWDEVLERVRVNLNARFL